MVLWVFALSQCVHVLNKVRLQTPFLIVLKTASKEKKKNHHLKENKRHLFSSSGWQVQVPQGPWAALGECSRGCPLLQDWLSHHWNSCPSCVAHASPCCWPWSPMCLKGNIERSEELVAKYCRVHYGISKETWYGLGQDKGTEAGTKYILLRKRVHCSSHATAISML